MAVTCLCAPALSTIRPQQSPPTHPSGSAAHFCRRVSNSHLIVHRIIVVLEMWIFIYIYIYMWLFIAEQRSHQVPKWTFCVQPDIRSDW